MMSHIQLTARMVDLGRRLVRVLCLTLLVLSAAAADWPQFRGQQGKGIDAGTGKLPETWDESAIAWKSNLPGRGPSSPIVVADRVIVTCSSGANQDRLHILAFATDSGKLLWERQCWATGRTVCHPTSANAAPTPASDGKRIFAFYSSNDLVCLDLDGNVQWIRGLALEYPRAGNDVGMASSPCVVGDTLVVQIECQGDSFATGIEPETGRDRWRVDRPTEAGWNSPIPFNVDGQPPQVLLQSPTKLTALNAATGAEMWTYRDACSGIPSAAVEDGRIFLPSAGLTALSPNGTSVPEVLWNAKALGPGSASPLVAAGHVYAINRAGVLNCAAAVDGKPEWKLRMTGSFWGTPALTADRLVCASQEGVVQVIDIADKHELLGKLDLGETIQSSPALVDGAVYLRSDQHLWKLGRK